MTQSSMYAYLEQCAELIAKNGWMVQGAFGSPTEPTYTYTIGLTEFDHPELILLGLPWQTAAEALNALGRRIRHHGETLAHHQVIHGLFNGGGDITFDATLIAIPDIESTHRMGVAHTIYGDKVTGLQVVWPDAQGRFPWQDGYDVDPRIQPLLGVDFPSA